MNWLVIGIGDVTHKRVFPAIASEPRSVLYGVVTRDRVKGERHAPRVWTKLEAALADPAVDAVYVATPVFLHKEQTLAALRAGKHVLCEKPFSLNYTDACEMVSAAKEARRLLGVAYFRRFYPKLLRARELLAAGAIGRVVFASAACAEWPELLPGDRGWLTDPLLSGSGPLYDIGSHRIDALNFLLGIPSKVSAQFSHTVRPMPVEDSATVLIEYENGARGMVDARWNTRVPLDELRVIGTDGTMDLGPSSGPQLRWNDRAEEHPCHVNRHYPCLENFVSAVLQEAPLACSAEGSLPAAWVLDQAVRFLTNSQSQKACSKATS